MLQTKNVSIIYTLGVRVELFYVLCGHFRQPEKWNLSQQMLKVKKFYQIYNKSIFL